MLSVLNWRRIALSVLDLFGIIIIVCRNALIVIMSTGLILVSSALVILMLVQSRLLSIKYRLRWRPMCCMGMFNLIGLLICQLPSSQE